MASQECQCCPSFLEGLASSNILRPIQYTIHGMYGRIQYTASPNGQLRAQKITDRRDTMKNINIKFQALLTNTEAAQLAKNDYGRKRADNKNENAPHKGRSLSFGRYIFEEPIVATGWQNGGRPYRMRVQLLAIRQESNAGTPERSMTRHAI